MLRIDKRFIESVRAAQQPSDLYELVQNAIRLEHATIPAYLCAYYTLKPGTNQKVASIIRSIVVEEMLHMTIASNLLIAIGAAPVIDKPGFMPVYPGPLPMNIGDGLIVGLEKCSHALVQNVFMEIESPEDPIQPKRVTLETGEEFHTIGEFYFALDEKLQAFGQDAFKGNFDWEVVDDSWFPPEQLFRITSPQDASRAIRIIVRQGEGTPASIQDPQGAAAHYYRFWQIVLGREIVLTADDFSFSGPDVILDENNVWNMRPNPDPDTLPKNSEARRRAIEFANAYTVLLTALHDTFNGAPQRLSDAMGGMFQLRLLAQKVLSTPELDASGAPTGYATGLSFRYQPTTAL